MQTSCYGWKACARLAAACLSPQSELLRRAVRRADGQTDGRTDKDPKHAQSEEVRPGRQSAVVVEIGCETVSHGITITTHTTTHIGTQQYTQTHSQQDRGAAAAQVILLPSHKHKGVEERARARESTHSAYVNRSHQQQQQLLARVRRINKT